MSHLRIASVAMNPILIGQKVSQETRMESVEIKDTNRGPAVFTTLSKIIKNKHGECLRESRKLVYLENTPTLSSSQRVIKRNLQPDYSYSLIPSSICLFQYSALTFNSHKIHYDLDYATRVEGYKNLLVHG
jgi:3-methylfumaryl-CoA hydratase